MAELRATSSIPTRPSWHVLGRETDIRKSLPNFDVKSLIGTNIDVFHKDPSHQRRLLGGLSSNHKGIAKTGGHTFQVIAHPVLASAASVWAPSSNGGT